MKTKFNKIEMTATELEVLIGNFEKKFRNSSTVFNTVKKDVLKLKKD